MHSIKESNYDYEEESPSLMRRSRLGSFKSGLSVQTSQQMGRGGEFSLKMWKINNQPAMGSMKSQRNINKAKTSFIVPKDVPRKLTMQASATNIMSPAKSLLSLSTAGSQTTPNRDIASPVRSSYVSEQSFKLIKDPSKGIDYSSEALLSA